ncbi:START domain [Pelomyxa schiedti]|nr:START domain [Pelomyxa schiedti]
MATTGAEDYEAKGAAMVERIKAAMSLSWSKIVANQGVTVYRHDDPSSPIPFVRGEAVFPGTSALAIIKALADAPKRPQYDDMCISGVVIRKLRDDDQGNKLTLGHACFKSPSMMVSARDFVFLSISTFDAASNSGIVVSQSVDLPEIPEKKPYVRGDLMISGYIIEPEPSGGMHINYFAQLDPKGWIPTAVVNSVAKDQPMLLAKFINQYKGKL